MRLLSWSLLGKSSARTSVTSAQSRTIPAPGTYIHEQDHSPPSHNKPSHPELALPARHLALFFTAAGLRFSDGLSGTQAAGHVQPWLLHWARGLLQLSGWATQGASPRVAAPMAPTRTWPRLRTAISTVLFSITLFPACSTMQSSRCYLCWHHSCEKHRSDDSLK